MPSSLLLWVALRDLNASSFVCALVLNYAEVARPPMSSGRFCILSRSLIYFIRQDPNSVTARYIYSITSYCLRLEFDLFIINLIPGLTPCRSAQEKVENKNIKLNNPSCLPLPACSPPSPSMDTIDRTRSSLCRAVAVLDMRSFAAKPRVCLTVSAVWWTLSCTSSTGGRGRVPRGGGGGGGR